MGCGSSLAARWGNRGCDWLSFKWIVVLGLVGDLRVEQFGLKMVRLGFWKREVGTVIVFGGLACDGVREVGSIGLAGVSSLCD
jgi:hypothetical protein